MIPLYANTKQDVESKIQQFKNMKGKYKTDYKYIFGFYNAHKTHLC